MTGIAGPAAASSEDPAPLCTISHKALSACPFFTNLTNIGGAMHMYGCDWWMMLPVSSAPSAVRDQHQHLPVRTCLVQNMIFQSRWRRAGASMTGGLKYADASLGRLQVTVSPDQPHAMLLHSGRSLKTVWNRWLVDRSSLDRA